MKLAFRNVSAGYRRGLRRRLALEDLTVELAPGEVTALLGPNGAGKTTLLRLASGTMRPWRGDVHPAAGHRHRVGYLPDRVELPGGQTLARFLRYGAFLAGLGRDRAEAAVVAAAADTRLAHALHRPLASFSLGMARRAALAFALLERPRALLLDEPWQGLDPASRATLRAVIRAEADRGTLVMVSSHELDEVVRLADRVLVLDTGRLVSDLRAPLSLSDLEAPLLSASPG